MVNSNENVRIRAFIEVVELIRATFEIPVKTRD